jgi:dTDP-4-amino-4,6-dideoxygalactose transaminase
MKFILRKDIKIDLFERHLRKARASNQFSNYGAAVQDLELKAREMLKIDDSKAIIAVNNGSSCVTTIVYAFQRAFGNHLNVLTQDFTFPSNAQIGASGAQKTDFTDALDIHLDFPYWDQIKIVIVTNIFGHLQDLNMIINKCNDSDKLLIFDNAATPYSFYEGTNSCNLGTASYISLHHTKPLGFGEGGLVIINKEYEKEARAVINFGPTEGNEFNERGSNFKMSEIAAAGILQWWDQFDIEDLKEKFLNNYFKKRYELANQKGIFYPNKGDDNFFPSCLPFIHDNPTEANKDNEEFKYYKPLMGLQNSKLVYENIICYGLTEDWYV